jgi:Ca-activated chloride channel family protein
MKPMSKILSAIAVFSLVLCAVWAQQQPSGQPTEQPTVGQTGAESLPITQGDLRAYNDEGKLLTFPLKHTRVNAEISGFIAKVMATQVFENPYDKPIEAIYVFPLPQDAAVEQMLMQVGDRVTVGEVHRREEARLIYEIAKARGKVASLLEQERPNIFTQSVANIRPGDEVIITIYYTELLIYDKGAYEFNFPMVVGPRYMPGVPTGKQGTGWSPDTTSVPDASRISPPVLKPGYRTGHDIDIEVTIDAGVPIQNLASKSHKIDILSQSGSRAVVRLTPEDTIPNKDFTLRYEVAGEKPQMALLTHRSGIGGYFMLMIQPQLEPTGTDLIPREVVFVLDVSGSMNGLPIEKSKEVVKKSLDGLGPDDTFRIITFSGSAQVMSEEALANTPENIARAKAFIDQQQGAGGTEMLKGVQAAMSAPLDPEYMRIVVFLTDGYIGNETQILAAIEEKLGPSRVFSFGIGSSVNRYLIQRMAEVGHGDAQFVRQDEDPEKAVQRFVERIQKPCLMDIKIDWGGLKVVDVYPARVPDLFAAQPVFLIGRYETPGSAVVTLRAIVAGEPFEQHVSVNFPDWQGENSALGSLWARMQIKELMAKQYQGEKPEIVQQITNLALDYHLMSQYTSFVAVDDETENLTLEEPITVTQPLPMPEGVSFEGVFGPMGEPGTPHGLVFDESLAREALYAGQEVKWSFIEEAPVSAGVPMRDKRMLATALAPYATPAPPAPASLAYPASVPPAAGAMKASYSLNAPAMGTVSRGDIKQSRLAAQVQGLGEVDRVANGALIASQEAAGKVFYFQDAFEFASFEGGGQPVQSLHNDWMKLAQQDKARFDKLQQLIANAAKAKPEELTATTMELLTSPEEHLQRIALGMILSENVREKIEKDKNLIKRVEEITGKANDLDTRILALAALHMIQPQKADAALRSAARSKEPAVRQIALYLAHQWESPVAPQLYLGGTKDADPGVRLLSAVGLSTGTLSQEARTALLNLVSDPKDNVSAAAIWSLGMARNDTVILAPCVTKLLSDQITSYPLSLVQAAVVYKKMWEGEDAKRIAGIGGMSPRDVWIGVIKRTAEKQEAPNVKAAREALRLIALNALENEKTWYYDTGDEVFEAVKSCLSDESENVRITAISGIGRFGERSVPIWMEVLTNTDKWPQPDVIEGAIGKLVTAMSEEKTRAIVSQSALTETLRSLLESEKIQDAKYNVVRAAALEGLVALNAASSTDKLERYALADRFWRVRRAALLGLAKQQKALALPTLIRALDDRSPAVRAVAVGMIAAVIAPEPVSEKQWNEMIADPTTVTMRKQLAQLGFDEALLQSRTAEVIVAFEPNIKKLAASAALKANADFQHRLSSTLSAAKGTRSEK